VVEDVIAIAPAAGAEGEEKIIWLTRYIIFQEGLRYAKDRK
jgi:hypothetical protein